MAEAAGLVLGGVALVGLISTCVEISEYLESAKNRAGDLKLALTKVNLIKQRLDDWGSARGSQPAGIPPPDPQSNHTIDPSACGVLLLIEETLNHIKDRKRFDSIIEHLDFLLSNLEKITETLQGRRGMAQNNITEERSVALAKQESHHPQSGTFSAALIMVTGEKTTAVDGGEEINSLQLSEQSMQGRPGHNQSDPLEANSNIHSKQTEPAAPTSDHRNEQGEAHVVFDHCEGNQASDRAFNFQGVIGTVQNTGEKMRNFVGNVAEDNAFNMQGAMSQEAFKTMLEARVDVKKGKGDERKASGKSSTGGTKKKSS